jgi:Domain of unknown function (DUF4249)
MNYKFTYFLIAIIACFAIYGCIEKYDPKLTADTPRLVVEGLLTDKNVPHTVQLSYAVAYNNTENSFSKPIAGATVWITEDKVVKATLLSAEYGKYITPTGFVAKVGKTYQLFIKLPDGKQYNSDPEPMIAPPPIDSVYSEFVYDPTKALQNRGTFKLYVSAKDPKDQTNYYQWTWYNYKRIKECNRFNRSVGQAGQVIYSQECCERDCWQINGCASCIFLASDALLNGKSLGKQPIGSIPYESTKLYYLLVEQRYISQKIYQFWKNLEEQTRNVGGIFDASPATIRGNINHSTDANDYAIGYFQVSGVRTKVTIIDRSKATEKPNPLKLSDTPTVPIECQPCNAAANHTSTRPEGWIKALDE